MTQKILLYGDVDLNVIDGSSIWLVNLAKLLAQNKDCMVDILLKKRIRNEVLVSGIKNTYNIRLLYVKEYIDHITEIDEHNITKAISVIDAMRDYSCYIIRGMRVVKAFYKNGNCDKLVPYLTDFCHNEQEISKEEVQFLASLYQKVHLFFVQTEAMKEYLENILRVDGQKFHILYPIVFDIPEPKYKEKNSIVYAGKIAKDWNILELMDIMDELAQTNPEIHLHMIGDKVNADMAEQKKQLFHHMNQADNIVFHGSLPRESVMTYVNQSMLGYSFRSRKVDHDHSLEVSVKLLEYCRAGVPMVLRRTRIHEEILGKDYPLYVESKEECIEKIKQWINSEKLIELGKQLKQNSEQFRASTIGKELFEALSIYPQKPIRLLISGHDLKFLKPLLPYMKQHYDVQVQELSEYYVFSEKEAKTYIQQADIIWCEWLLTAAQWYSLHRYPHQHLFIRGHRFEVHRAFGKNLKLINVDKIITVSYYYYEEFRRAFKIPLEKITIINNFIDVAAYPTEKISDAFYHLALIGALPKRKGLLKAVELLHILKESDNRYCLHVPGKRPEEFPNTKNVEEEWNYYQEVYATIKRYHLEDSVFFDGWVDVSAFLKNIGYVLSLSDPKQPESFHVTPFEGLASNAMALALPWEGIEYLYPKVCRTASIQDMANRILDYNQNPEQRTNDIQSARDYVIHNYDISLIWAQIHSLLKGEYNETPFD